MGGIDPNLFHLDWERTFEALAGVVVLSFIVERVAALLFESRPWVTNTSIPQANSEAAKVERTAYDLAVRVREITNEAWEEARNRLAAEREAPPGEIHPSDADLDSGLRLAARDALRSEVVGRIVQRSPLWPLDPTMPMSARARANEVLYLLEHRQRRRRSFASFPVKEGLAFALAASVCVPTNFDLIAIVLLLNETTVLGSLLTAGVVAGGSKASMKLFQDVFKARSGAMRSVRDELDNERSLRS